MRTLALLSLLALATPGLAADVGQPAPDFALQDLGDLSAGRPVKTPETKAYGCGVKYAN
jgi:hypothetical protein